MVKIEKLCKKFGDHVIFNNFDMTVNDGEFIAVTGNSGCGKTTIINAIVKLYIETNKLSNLDIAEQIALLAPTGRASKKMSLSTGLPASTIHRYKKWNK